MSTKQSNRKVTLKVTSAIIALSLGVSAGTAALHHATVLGFAMSLAGSVLVVLTAFAISVLANLFDSHLNGAGCSNCRNY